MGINNPLQINIDFLKTDSRSFRSEWYKQYKWLERSVKRDAAFWCACRILTKESAANSKDAFVRKGFNN